MVTVSVCPYDTGILFGNYIKYMMINLCKVLSDKILVASIFCKLLAKYSNRAVIGRVKPKFTGRSRGHSYVMIDRYIDHQNRWDEIGATKFKENGY